MKYSRHLSRDILMGCLAFTLLLGVLVAVISLHTFKMAMDAQYRTRIEDLLDLTMSQIDVEDLEACMQTNEPSEAFLALTDFMDDIRQNCALDYIVICRPVKDGDDQYDVVAVASGLLPEERAGEDQKDFPIPKLGDSIGAMYPADFIPEIYDDMINRRDVKFSTSHTNFGTSYDGAVAILNAQGEGIALLTAGLSTSEIRSTMWEYGFLIGGGIIAVAALLMLFMNVWLGNRVVRPLKLIEQSTADFAAKSWTHNDPEAMILTRPDIHSGDELESLADAIVTLSENMKAYAENMVRSAVQVETMRQEVTKATDLAHKDALTGVRNKAAFDDKARELNDMLAAGNVELALVMLDLNRLKHINDTYGHEKGDLYLKNACKLICNIFSHSPVYRVGGDEFVVVLLNGDFASRELLFKRFKQGMRSDSYLYEWERVSVAMGCAIYDPKLDADVEALLARADQAMYENKKKMKKTMLYI